MAKPIASWEYPKVGAVFHPPWPWQKFQQKNRRNFTNPKNEKNKNSPFKKPWEVEEKPPWKSMSIAEILDAWNRHDHLDFNEPQGLRLYTSSTFPPKPWPLLRFAKPTWGKNAISGKVVQIESSPSGGWKYQKHLCNHNLYWGRVDQLLILGINSSHLQ